MKFTKFIAASLAVLVMFSCSKEVLDTPNEPKLNPGEAQIVVDLSRSAGTTYSTIEKEFEIGNGSARLFYADGTEQSLTSVSVSNNKLTALVPVGFIPGAAKLCVFVNATPADATDKANARENHLASTVSAAITRDLATGAPAAIEFEVTLHEGVVSGSNIKLKRAIARLGAKSGNGLSIEDYNVKLNGVNLTSGMLYGGMTNAMSSLEGSQEVNYTLDLDGISIDDKLTSGIETVAYMYPSKEVTITVKSTANVEKTVTFAPRANMNYTLKISPSTDNSLAFDLSIDAWDASTEVEVDFGNKPATAQVNPTSIAGIAGIVSVSGNNIEMSTSGIGDGANFVEIADIFGEDGNPWIITSIDESKGFMTYAIDQFAATSTDERLKVDCDQTSLKLALMPNNTGSELTYYITANLIRGSNENEETAQVVLTLKQAAISYPSNFSVVFGGQEWMTIGTQSTGKLVDDIAIIDEVNNVNGANFEDKYISFMQQIANHNKVAGALTRYSPGTAGDALNAPTPKCPAGYIVPPISVMSTSLFGLRTEPNYTGSTYPAFPFVAHTTDYKPSESKYTFRYEYLHTAGAEKGQGYLKITDDSGATLILPWRGNMQTNGSIINNRVSGFVSSSANPFVAPSPGATLRYIIGVDSNYEKGVAELTAVANNNANSSLVRCVKLTPELYWTK